MHYCSLQHLSDGFSLKLATFLINKKTDYKCFLNLVIISDPSEAQWGSDQAIFLHSAHR